LHFLQKNDAILESGWVNRREDRSLRGHFVALFPFRGRENVAQSVNANRPARRANPLARRRRSRTHGGGLGLLDDEMLAAKIERPANAV
jgi:hypothetical protein